MRVVIVDDEALARAILREHLAAHPDVEIVAECANGFEAVKAIAGHAPDLVFLDIQMPKLDGFEVVELAGTATRYIFVTAYDQFALRAFDVHAIDYLLKPFSRERFDAALAQARERLPPGGSASASAPAPTAAQPALQAVVDEAAARRLPLERILIRDGARAHVVAAANIEYIEAEDDYVAIHAEGRTWLKSQRLAELEGQLDPARFLRVHRSYIVNVDAIVRIEPATRDTWCAVLRSGGRVPVSRNGYPKVRDLIR
jgi:two-component system LytT family response regulator